MTPAIGVSRTPCRGCNAGWAAICRCRSGEELHRTQRPPSLETAIEDCVRAIACSDPSRWPRQLRQLQFHCGKPPPAADPSTRISTGVGKWRAEAPGHPGRYKSAVGRVGRDLEPKSPLDRQRCFPLHGLPPHRQLTAVRRFVARVHWVEIYATGIQYRSEGPFESANRKFGATRAPGRCGAKSTATKSLLKHTVVSLSSKCSASGVGPTVPRYRAHILDLRPPIIPRGRRTDPDRLAPCNRELAAKDDDASKVCYFDTFCCLTYPNFSESFACD